MRGSVSMRNAAALAIGAVLHASSAAQTPFPEPPDARLAAGRTVWLGTCRDCHANSLSDAPQYKEPAAWTARLARGREALYGSALKGRAGANGAEMPARGGNAMLNDDDVRAAVDYMLFLVSSRKESK